MKLVSFESVSYAYSNWFRKSRSALDGISMSIEEGESFGFVGQNGAGKSTAIKLLLGFVRPTSGDVILNGLPPVDHRSRHSVGYVPEFSSLPTMLTPREILTMGRALRIGNQTGAKAEVDTVMAQLDIAEVADNRVGKFSKGMGQRVTIALALMGKPKLLVLDEPLSGLDPKGRTDVVNLLASYQAEGGAIFFSSHVLHDVERLADRVALLHHGKIHAIHDVGALLAATQGQYTIRYSGPPLSPTVTVIRQGVCLLTCCQSELTDNLLKIQRIGGAVLELKPTDSLESRFFSMIQ